MTSFPCVRSTTSNSFPFQKLPTPKSPNLKNQAKAQAKVQNISFIARDGEHFFMCFLAI
jgi:hypothetical protein